MNTRLLITAFAVITITVLCAEGKKSFGSFKSRSSSSARGSGRKTNYNPQPAPTSLSYPQASAPKPVPKPSLFGWQEKPKTQARPSSTGNGQTHSYPSSNTGLSGNQPKQPPPHQESAQRTQNLNQQSAPHPASQPANSHSYPSSNGLSGSSGGTQQVGSGYPNQQKASYPQQAGGHSGAGAYPSSNGLSGNSGGTQQVGSGYPNQPNTNYPQQAGGLSGAGVAPPPYPGTHNNGPAYSGNNGPAYQGNNYGNSYHHPQGPPPPYSNNGGYGGGGYGGGGYGGHSYNPGYGAPMGYSPQMPGYFGNYGSYGNKGFGGGVSRGSSALTGVGIAGAGVGTLLTGLALWNLARSTGRQHHTVIYDNRGQPVAVAPASSNTTEPTVDPFLADLVNCTLTISNTNATEVLAIPCAIATSFTPDAEVKDLENNKNPNDSTKCTVTVVNKSGKEFETTIPCSILLNTAAENNVTEPPPEVNNPSQITNGTVTPDAQMDQNQPSALSLSGSNLESNNNSSDLNCTPQPGEIRDPINPCFAITHNVTVLPLQTTEKSET